MLHKPRTPSSIRLPFPFRAAAHKHTHVRFIANSKYSSAPSHPLSAHVLRALSLSPSPISSIILANACVSLFACPSLSFPCATRFLDVSWLYCRGDTHETIEENNIESYCACTRLRWWKNHQELQKKGAHMRTHTCSHTRTCAGARACVCMRVCETWKSGRDRGSTKLPVHLDCCVHCVFLYVCVCVCVLPSINQRKKKQLR